MSWLQMESVEPVAGNGEVGCDGGSFNFRDAVFCKAGGLLISKVMVWWRQGQAQD